MDINPLNTDQLEVWWQSALEGDTDAFRHIHQELFQGLFNYSLKVLQDSALAGEVRVAWWGLRCDPLVFLPRSFCCWPCFRAAPCLFCPDWVARLVSFGPSPVLFACSRKPEELRRF